MSLNLNEDVAGRLIRAIAADEEQLTVKELTAVAQVHAILALVTEVRWVGDIIQAQL